MLTKLKMSNKAVRNELAEQVWEQIPRETELELYVEAKVWDQIEGTRSRFAVWWTILFELRDHGEAFGAN